MSTSLDVFDFDFLQGTGIQAQNEALAATTQTDGLTAVGTATQIVGFTSGGTPEAKSVGGNGSGVTLAFNGNTLQANADQDLKTTGSPTFAGLTVGGVVLQPVKNNYTAVVAPTVNDDSGDGYAVGSQWIDTALDDAYICCDATLTAAVWKLIT